MSDYIKDPDAFLDYSIDWTSWLDGDSIIDSTWLVSGPDNLLVASLPSILGGVKTLIWLAAGSGSNVYKVTNHITTAAGREDDWTILIEIKEQ